jgi:hypothetical protein
MKNEMVRACIMPGINEKWIFIFNLKTQGKKANWEVCP